MSNYLSAPLSGEDIRGGFQYVDEPHRLTPEDNEVLAAQLVRETELGHHAVWFSPLVDGREAFVDRQPLELNGRRLRYTPRNEGAIFPEHQKKQD